LSGTGVLGSVGPPCGTVPRPLCSPSFIILVVVAALMTFGVMVCVVVALAGLTGQDHRPAERMGCLRGDAPLRVRLARQEAEVAGRDRDSACRGGEQQGGSDQVALPHGVFTRLWFAEENRRASA
jgi:hypothetical protein